MSRPCAANSRKFVQRFKNALHIIVPRLHLRASSTRTYKTFTSFGVTKGQYCVGERPFIHCRKVYRGISKMFARPRNVGSQHWTADGKRLKRRDVVWPEECWKRQAKRTAIEFHQFYLINKAKEPSLTPHAQARCISPYIIEVTLVRSAKDHIEVPAGCLPKNSAGLKQQHVVLMWPKLRRIE